MVCWRIERCTLHCSIPMISAAMITVCRARATMNFHRNPMRSAAVSPESMDAASVRYDRRMPLIRCPKCGQAYDVPGAVAVHLPNSIATCHCGEWLSGSKAAVLARLLNPEEIKEIDLQPYKVSDSAPAATAEPPAET